jgi:hypothetical protein
MHPNVSTGVRNPSVISKVYDRRFRGARFVVNISFFYSLTSVIFRISGIIEEPVLVSTDFYEEAESDKGVLGSGGWKTSVLCTFL